MIESSAIFFTYLFTIFFGILRFPFSCFSFLAFLWVSCTFLEFHFDLFMAVLSASLCVVFRVAAWALWYNKYMWLGHRPLVPTLSGVWTPQVLFGSFIFLTFKRHCIESLVVYTFCFSYQMWVRKLMREMTLHCMCVDFWSFHGSSFWILQGYFLILLLFEELPSASL